MTDGSLDYLHLQKRYDQTENLVKRKWLKAEYSVD